MGERTGSRVFQWVWSYVTAKIILTAYIGKYSSVSSVLVGVEVRVLDVKSPLVPLLLLGKLRLH
ncbi:hypothetical protein CCHR01_07954 [Colletotrichum chrysophilum]|uniref:Uncharacterized protein n=1 Tax=Colletotrichum chrysophilum TaxID=1836956 RepID=A0AAD9EIB8_9PEZI|nr:hypothetical protein CCHR01_07954 [Colletotrichum chrysophilum]